MVDPEAKPLTKVETIEGSSIDVEPPTKVKRPKTAKQGKKKASAKKAPARPPRPFPALPLENVLKIPQILKEKNGGNPWAPAEIAKALNRSPKTADFYYLTASSRDYGLTSGARDSAKIVLQPIGHDFVYAASKEAEQDAMKRAFFNVPLFKDA